MKLKIVKINKNTDYQRWLDFRQNGIGASEVASILSLNQWKCAHEVYYQKLGVIPQMQEENIAMFMGNELEDLAASHYEYWGGSPESMIQNKRSATKLRTLYSPIGYVIHPDYPHLFFSPDRLELVNKENGKKVVVRSGVLDTEQVSRVIEIKTISGFAQKVYEDGFNPAYGIQLMTYLMGLEIGEGSIFTMADGRNYTEQIINYDEEVVDQIKRATTEFWERVIAGREALAKGGDYDQFAPPPDGTKAYEAFLRNRFRDPEDVTIQNPPEEMWLAAVAMKEAQEREKEVGSEVTLQKNIIMNFMGNMSQLDFGIQGKITWRPDGKGGRRFVNMIKI